MMGAEEREGLRGHRLQAYEWGLPTPAPTGAGPKMTGGLGWCGQSQLKGTGPIKRTADMKLLLFAISRDSSILSKDL